MRASANQARATPRAVLKAIAGREVTGLLVRIAVRGPRVVVNVEVLVVAIGVQKVVGPRAGAMIDAKADVRAGGRSTDRRRISRSRS